MMSPAEAQQVMQLAENLAQLTLLVNELKQRIEYLEGQSNQNQGGWIPPGQR